MTFKNFAGMTINDFMHFKKNNVNLSQYFTEYYNQNTPQIKWTNALLRQFGYMDNNIPITFKDNMYIAGQIASSGSHMLENFKAPFDSHMYTLCQKHHINVHGSGNMDELAMGSHNIYSYFGKVLNPINIHNNKKFDIKDVGNIADDQIITPGGSGGGPLVCTSMGLSLGAFGTDTGGSLRGPAEWNGLVGYKPTFGNISRYGIAELSSHLDTISLAGKTVDCVKKMAKIFIDNDPKDSVCQPILHTPKITKKIATFNYIVKNIIDPHSYEAMIKAQDKLREAGYIVEEVKINENLFQYMDITYSIICYSDASSSLGTYNGLLYGAKMQKEGSLTDRIYKGPRSEGLGLLQAKRRSIIGKLLLQPEYKICHVAAYKYISQLYKHLCQNVFNHYDCLLTPANGITPRINNLQSSGQNGALTSDIWLCMSNLFGGPAISVPVDKNQYGMHGVQLCGNIGEDLKILDIAEDLDNIFKFNEKFRGKCEYINDNKYEFIVEDK